MDKLVKKVAGSVLGIALLLGWWTIRDGGNGSTTQEGIPAKVWSGGAGALKIDVETSVPARFSVTFEEAGEEGRYLETWQNVPAGSHSWTVDIPTGVGGTIEMTTSEAPVGTKMHWVIRLDDEILAEEAQTLEEPLQAGYAFGLQTYMEDYSRGE